jgi:hypothetical protein
VSLLALSLSRARKLLFASTSLGVPSKSHLIMKEKTHILGCKQTIHRKWMKRVKEKAASSFFFFTIVPTSKV